MDDSDPRSLFRFGTPLEHKDSKLFSESNMDIIYILDCILATEILLQLGYSNHKVVLDTRLDDTRGKYIISYRSSDS